MYVSDGFLLDTAEASPKLPPEPEVLQVVDPAVCDISAARLARAQPRRDSIEITM